MSSLQVLGALVQSGSKVEHKIIEGIICWGEVKRNEKIYELKLKDNFLPSLRTCLYVKQI